MIWYSGEKLEVLPLWDNVYGVSNAFMSLSCRSYAAFQEGTTEGTKLISKGPNLITTHDARLVILTWLTARAQCCKEAYFHFL